MRLPANVVGLWATGNVVLSLILLIYGRGLIPLFLHIGSSAAIAVFGAGVLVSAQRRGIGPPLHVAYRSVAAASAGLVVLILALSAVYGPWLLVVAAYPAVLTVVTVRSERVRAGASSPASEDEATVRAPLPVPVEAPPSMREIRAEALEIAHNRRRQRRGEAT